MGTFEVGKKFDIEGAAFRCVKACDSDYSAYLKNKPLLLSMDLNVEGSVAAFQDLHFTLENKKIVKDRSMGILRNVTFSKTEKIYVERIDNRPRILNEYSKYF